MLDLYAVFLNRPGIGMSSINETSSPAVISIPAEMPSALEPFFPGFVEFGINWRTDFARSLSYSNTFLGDLTTPYIFSAFSISSATLTTALVLIFFFTFISAYTTSLTGITEFNKRYNFFFIFTRWAFNYLTGRPFKAIWGFMFRSVFIIVGGIIFVSNLLGLISISFVLTSYLSVTLALAILAFVSFNLASITFFETNWLRVFLPYNLPLITAYPVVALELVSYTLRVISLSVRLFANITSGHLLINVLSGILWSLITALVAITTVVIWIPFALILLAVSVMEVFISFLQGFVFLILLKIYSDDSFNIIQSAKDIELLLQSYSQKIVTESRLNVKKQTAAKKTVKKGKQNTNKSKEQTKPEPVQTSAAALNSTLYQLPSLKVSKIEYTASKINVSKPEQDQSLRRREDYGVISKVDGGIIYITGLPGLSVGEIVYFGRHLEQAITLNLERNVAKAVIFSSNDSVAQGAPVFRTFRLMKVPISKDLLGKVVDCLGNSLVSKQDSVLPTQSVVSRTVDVKALGVIDRKSINEPLVTGILSIDAMLPIGRGQRELIIGDRQLGKTSLAVDSIISQKNLHVSEWRVLPPVYCIYVAVGQKLSSLARLAAQLKNKNALYYSIIVSASAAEAAAMQYLVPYIGCAIAEWFLSRNGHTLIVYDDLGIQATAYRQLSLLLRRPPGREAYPGDIFYLHSRLLERAAKVNEANGLGSITALPIVETKDGDLSAYIPTNVISITDGQVFLSAAVFYKDIKPAISFTKSVSRVGSKAQTKGVKRLVGLLKRLLALYEDLKYYETLDTGELNEAIKSVLDAGYHLMTIFKQKKFRPYILQEQFVLIWAAILGFNDVSREDSDSFKLFLVRSIAFDSWDITSSLNLGINKHSNVQDIFVLLNIYYWEKCIIYNSKRI